MAYGFYGWQNAAIQDELGLTPRDYYDLLSQIWSADTCTKDETELVTGE